MAVSPVAFKEVVIDIDSIKVKRKLWFIWWITYIDDIHLFD